ncbi:uncharacterized protein LOC131605657 [Vicia villosa]|uniref:uncharacterized protein LOC131605657 n=1 Tax=Vicia villosa TaxID=3911 RepID=UPI00273B36EB|nr:uncharacterized protein LOC131605657 [Vicia villosa]
MEKWKDIPFSKEEEEGVIAAEDEICEEESFQRTLAGRLWTDSNFNARAFKSTMLNAWKLKNPVDIQDLSKNLFLFKFTTKRDLDTILRNGPWSFDRSLLVLNRISGEEQPSELKMHYGSFWVRIYELPLMLRSETMARKIGNIIGVFEEMDGRETCRTGRFLRIKVTIDLKNPLKRGTVVKFKEKDKRVHFKYERLPTFCFMCGRLGHQLKDCESLEELTEEGFEELDEQDLSYGQWLRASPLPKMTEDQRKRDSSSGTCSRSLFPSSTSQSRCSPKEIANGAEAEAEVQQKKSLEEETGAEGNNITPQGGKNLDIEVVAESFGAVAINTDVKKGGEHPKPSEPQRRKWIRRKSTKKHMSNKQKEKAIESSKRQLVDVMITEGTIEDCMSGEKKRRQEEAAPETTNLLPEVVLDTQHRLQQ